MTKKYCDICGREIDPKAYPQNTVHMKDIKQIDFCESCARIMVESILDLKKQASELRAAKEGAEKTLDESLPKQVDASGPLEKGNSYS